MLNFFKRKRKSANVEKEKSVQNVHEIIKQKFDLNAVPENVTYCIYKDTDNQISVKKTKQSNYIIVGQKDENGMLVQSYVQA